MPKLFTQEKIQNVAKKESEQNRGPKEVTINFLKQFARVYSYETRLPQNLGSFVAN